MRSERRLLVAHFNEFGRKPFDSNADRPCAEKEFRDGKHGKRVVGGTIARKLKRLWDSRPRKRAGRNPKEEIWEKYLLKERLHREKEKEL